MRKVDERREKALEVSESTAVGSNGARVREKADGKDPCWPVGWLENLHLG